MNNLTAYLAAAPKMRSGDVVIFSGDTGVGPLIELAEGSPVSHIAIVRQGSGPCGVDVKILESTIEKGKSGVQTNLLGERLASYAGRAAWLPLSDESRKAIDWFCFYAAIGDMEDRVKYDTPGLFKSLARMTFLGHWFFQSEETDKLVCSGTVSEVFERSKLLRGINASKVTPADLTEMALYRENVPILNGGIQIPRFNTL